ncbi:response regulator [Acidobacteriota bacterium]
MKQEATRVLLVDDEVAFLEVVQKRMSKRNVHITPASSGSAAVAILRQQDFEVAVVDLKMEDMDGLEVLKIFKTMVPELPVIMLTGHGSETAAREGMKLGAFDYLTKPCDLEELLKKIQNATQRAR